MQRIDHYLWNEQTAVVLALAPELEQKHPHVWRWYEVRDGLQAFQEQGHPVFSYCGHWWVGCPRDITIEQLVAKLPAPAQAA